MKGPTRRLRVLDGLHQGARVALADGQRLTLGQADECDLRLLDPGIAAVHLRLEANGERLRVHALAPGVQVRGRPLRVGKSARLAVGEVFHAAETGLCCEAVLPAAMAATPDDAAAAAAPAASARHRPSLRSDRPRLLALVLGGAALLSVGIALWPALTQWRQPTAAALASAIGKAWPDVTRTLDPASGRPLYSGRVADERALALLRAQVARVEGLGAGAQIRVAVGTRIVRELEELLSQHYAASRVVELQPGKYRITTAGPASYLDALAWDTTGLAREAKSRIRGIDALAFAQDPTLLAQDAVLPLSVPAWNLVSTPRGHWIADGSSRRYFEGATLPDGQLLRLGKCSVQLVDRAGKRLLRYQADPAHAPCY